MKALIRDDAMPIFLYDASSIDEICEAVIAGASPEPIAKGTIRVVLNDNDVLRLVDPHQRLRLQGDRDARAAGRYAMRLLGDVPGAGFYGEHEFRALVEDIHSNS